MAMNDKGQGTLETLLSIPIVIIGLLVVFIMLDPIGKALFDALNASCSNVITNVATIKLIVGLVGLIVAAMALISIVQSFRRPSYPQGYA